MTSAEFSYLASIGYAGSVSDKRNAYYNDMILYGADRSIVPSGDKVVAVSTSGSDAASARFLGLPFLTVDAAALTLVGTNGGKLKVGKGTFNFSGITTRTGRSIEGMGRNATVLNYTGVGTAIGSETPNTRTYGIFIAHMTVQTSTGAVGLDLASVSSSGIHEVTFNGFSDAGVRYRSPINGGCVYNNAYGVTVVGAGSGSSSIGFDAAASGSNTNGHYGCGSRSNQIGVRITDANHFNWFGGAIESNNHGTVIESTTIALADNATFDGVRFENNVTSNWKIGETTGLNVRNTWLVHLSIVTSPGGDVELGDRIHRHTSQGIAESSAAPASSSGTYRFERTVSGGSELPNFVVADTVSSNGTPVTLQVNTERTAGYFFRGTRAGTNYFDIDASGNIRQSQGSYIEMKERATDPAAPAADMARLYARDNGSGKTQLCVRFPTGAIQVIATEP